MYRITMILFSAALASATLAGSHIQMTNYGPDNLETGRTDIYTQNGDLLMEETGSSHEVYSSGEAGGQDQSRAVHDERVRERMVFHKKTQEMLAQEGNSKQCQRISKETKMPKGMMPQKGQMADYQKQMAQGMAALNDALDEAREGMSAEDQKIFDQYTKGLSGGPAGLGMNTDDVRIRKTDRRKKIGQWDAIAYEVVNGNDEVLFVMWLTDISKVSGGREMKNAMIGLVDFFDDVLEGFGIDELMDANELKFFRDEALANLFMVRQEDLSDGSYSELTYAKAGAVDKNFYPDCEKVDMLEALGGR